MCYILFEFSEFGKSNKNNKKIRNFMFDRVIRFSGNDMPPFIDQFDLTYKVLFIPESPNYPGVDFLIWDSENKELSGFQITIGGIKNHRKSVDSFLAGNLKEKWKNLCKINEDKFFFVWVIPDNAVEEITNDGYDNLYIPFSNIRFQFPALTPLAE